MSTGNPASAATEEAFAGTHPSPGGRRSDQPAVVGPVEVQRDHNRLRDTQQGSSAGSSHGCRTSSQLDALSSSTITTTNCGGTLQHVGGILRCRSANADPLTWASGGDCDEGGDTRHPSMEPISRPTLRAYSAPHFLHAALFPPKSCAPATGRRAPVAGSNMSASGSERSSVRGRAGGGEWTDQEALEAATVKAPCQHHPQGGYLHRYMGFEQEKVFCPPVDTFRALGGLGEFPRRRRRRCSTAPAVGQPQGRLRMVPPTHVDGGGGFEPEITEPGRRGLLDRDCPLAIEDPSDQTNVEEARASPYPLELFAEGSSVAPVSSSDGVGGGDGAAAAAARCGESSRRPRGAKRQKSWATGAHEKSRSSRTTKTCALHPGRKTGDISAGAGARRCGSACGSSSSPYSCSSKRPSVFLPYSLQRPVTQERKAFFYTSN